MEAKWSSDEKQLEKVKTETYKSHNLQPLACPTTEGNSENKIKTETYKSHNLHPSFLPQTTTKYFPTHAVDLVIIDEAHHYSARTKKNNIAFLQRKRKKGETDHLSRRADSKHYGSVITPILKMNIIQKNQKI